jgi:predicted membrane chloride channel (bestrophin family)
MGLLKSFSMIFTATTVVVVTCAVISTYLCQYYQIYADFPTTLLGLAVVFPIVFSIGTAYARREKALVYYGSMKSHGRSIFFAARDWVPKPDKSADMKLKKILENMLKNCRDLFLTKVSESHEKEKEVYKRFSELSKFIVECRARGMGTSDFSRINQYMAKMLDSFENLKHIYQYRTPVTLRAYSKIFIYVLPICYGPYFAHLGKDFPFLLVYVMPVLLSIILVSLDNIQDHLENPFDLVGEDDVKINVEKFIDKLDV